MKSAEHDRRQDRMARPEAPGDVVYDPRLGAEISLYGRDRGTAERWTKSKLIEVGGARGSTGRHALDEEGCPLERYYRRRLLSDPNSVKRGEENEARHEASLRFLGDWERGGRRPRLIARLDGVVTTSGRWHRDGGSSWAPWAEAYLAMDRWAACVHAVVCFDESAKAWAERRHRRMPHPDRVGMMALRLGLERLVVWYSAIDRSRRVGL